MNQSICFQMSETLVSKAHSQVCDNFWQLKALFKLMKIVFYFTYIVLFVLKIFIFFCSDFFDLVGKWLDKKAKVNFKICDVRTCETNKCNTLLPNISISKDNQKMKFLENHTQNLVEKLVPDLFLKIQN